MHSLGQIASIRVLVVTGANGFSAIPDDVMKQYELEQWARPLLAKTTDCPGLMFLPSDL